jgi:hypothetical protein
MDLVMDEITFQEGVAQDNENRMCSFSGGTDG